MAISTAPDPIEVIAKAMWNGSLLHLGDWRWDPMRVIADLNVLPDGSPASQVEIDRSTKRRARYREMAEAVIEALVKAQGKVDPDDADAGHRFEISIRSAGSSSVVGDTHHKDGEYFESDVPMSATVRAWNLRDALLLAVGVPLPTWFENRNANEKAVEDTL